MEAICVRLPSHHCRLASVQVVEGSQTACQMVCSQLLPKLLPLCTSLHTQQPGTEAHQDPALALSAILTILQAARRLVPTNKGQAHDLVMLNGGQRDLLNGAGSLILAAVRTQEPSASRTAREAEQVRHAPDDEQDQSLMQLANTTGCSPKANEGADAQGLSANAVKPLQLQILTELVSFPAELAVLPHQVVLSVTKLYTSYCAGNLVVHTSATARLFGYAMTLACVCSFCEAFLSRLAGETLCMYWH